MPGDSNDNQNKSADLDEGSLEELRQSQWSLASDMGALFRKIRSFQTELDEATTGLRTAQETHASTTEEVHNRSSALATRLEAQAGQLMSMHQAMEKVGVELDLAKNEQARALEEVSAARKRELESLRESQAILDDMINSLDERTSARFFDHEERHRFETAALEEAHGSHAEALEEVRDGLDGLGQQLNLQADELLALQRWAEATAAYQARTIQDHADALEELHLAHQDHAAALRQVQQDQASALEEVRETQKLALDKVRRRQHVLNERLAAQAGLTHSVQELLEDVVAAQARMDRSHTDALEAVREEQEAQERRLLAQTHLIHLLNERVEETTIEQTRTQEVRAREAEAQAVEIDELNASLRQEREAREAQWYALEELRAELDSVQQKQQAELHVREELDAALREKLELQADQIRELQELVESFCSADQDRVSSSFSKLQCA
jgi:hypothetical protein